VGVEGLGLTDAEADARRQAGRGNTTSPPTGRTYGAIVRENVFTFVNDVLFLLGLALVAVGRPLDALISVGVILVNVAISVAQEVRAKRTLDRIALLTRPLATVVREGAGRQVAPEELVVGDRLRAGPGDQIVLDGRVLEGSVQVDESLLTGESDLVGKRPGDEVYSGSFCVTGSADYEAEKVGADSLANRMTAGARGFRRILTPIQREINSVIRITLLIVLYMELLLILRSLLTLVSLPESVAQATVLAGLVPNGLFLSIAVAYAIGAVRIIRFGALVQQSNAIESLSSVDVLCLDKTGTLTANSLRVRSIDTLGGSEEELRSALGVIAASTSAPNQTSDAIATAFPGSRVPALTEVPFSSARKWSALAFGPAGIGAPRGVYALGAPEMLRPYADGGDALDWGPIEERIRLSAERGLRVLLVVHSPYEQQLRDGDSPELPGAMRPLGLVVLSDELRPEAAETLAAFGRLDVDVKVISGDSAETVAALARQAGLPASAEVRTGAELAALDAAGFAAAAESTSVFGRVTPEQKEALVAELRRRHYVAMIGDGVNDVLSLKGANLAVAMQSGSQATRGVADLILTNDSFAALVPALTEGQRIVSGMRDILKVFLTRITTVALVIMASLFIGVFPIALRNGSVLSVLTVGIPSVALAVWASPRRVRGPSLGSELIGFVLPVAVVSSLLGLLVFYGVLLAEAALSGSDSQAEILSAVPLAQSALISFLVFCGLLVLVFLKPPSRWWARAAEVSPDRRPAVLAVVLMVAFVVISAVPGLRRLFDLQPMNLEAVGIAVLAVVIWVLVLRLIWRARLLERYLAV
jgi:cation-transporting ATPase E